MPFRLTRRIYEIGAICVAIALSLVMIDRLLGAHGLALANGNPVFGDFIAFWAAGRAALMGQADLVHHVPTIQAIEWQAVPGMRWVAGWNSPPQFLLIATILGLFPFPVAALIWLCGTGALYLFAARKLLPDSRALIFAATAPAAFYHIGSIQTGLWVAGITGLALYWLDKKPTRAGALIALLAIKPHLAILWPLYLALTGRWRAFAAAAVAFTMFTLAAILAFGWDSIPRFLANLAATQHLIDAELVSKTTFGSFYGNLLAMDTPRVVAMGVQALSAIIALGAAVFIFRRGDARAQGVALCAATMLTSPYLFFYDTTLLAIGAAMLGAPRDKFETVALIFGWGAGLSLAIAFVQPLPICPLASWLVLAAALRRTLAPAGAPQRIPTEDREAHPDQSKARSA